MVEVLFTTTNMITSKLIRKISGEDCSHCALRLDDMVVHASFVGVKVVPYKEFKKKNKIKHRIYQPLKEQEIDPYILRSIDKGYDFKALFYLGLRYLFPQLMPKVNLWQTTGMYLCTEFITNLLYKEEDSLITPHKLYEKLVTYKDLGI